MHQRSQMRQRAQSHNRHFVGRIHAQVTQGSGALGSEFLDVGDFLQVHTRMPSAAATLRQHIYCKRHAQDYGFESATLHNLELIRVFIEMRSIYIIIEDSLINRERVCVCMYVCE